MQMRQKCYTNNEAMKIKLRVYIFVSKSFVHIQNNSTMHLQQMCGLFGDFLKLENSVNMRFGSMSK